MYFNKANCLIYHLWINKKEKKHNTYLILIRVHAVVLIRAETQGFYPWATYTTIFVILYIDRGLVWTPGKKWMGDYAIKILRLHGTNYIIPTVFINPTITLCTSVYPPNHTDQCLYLYVCAIVYKSVRNLLGTIGDISQLTIYIDTINFIERISVYKFMHTNSHNQRVARNKKRMWNFFGEDRSETN